MKNLNIETVTNEQVNPKNQFSSKSHQYLTHIEFKVTFCTFRLLTHQDQDPPERLRLPQHNYFGLQCRHNSRKFPR